MDSQLGGLVPPAVDIFNQAHSGAANKQHVIDTCIGLLRTRPSSTFFAQGFPFGCDPPPYTPPSGTVPTLRTSGGVLISDPPPGSSAPAGGTVAFGATGGPGSALTKVLVTFPGTMPVAVADPFTATLTIPSGAYGTVTLTVFGKHADGSISTAERTITVTTTAALTGLTADPPDIGMFSRGHRERAFIEGTFADSSKRDLTAASRGTTYLSGNTDIVTVDADGWLTPVANGTTTVTATNGAKSAIITVAVAFVPESDLALTGPGAAIVLFAGESAVLSFSAANHGPDPARPANVFVDGPSAVALTDTTASSGAWDNNAAPVWNEAPFAVAASAALSVTVKAVAPGSGTVVATITGTGRDFTVENNGLSIPVRVFADPHFAFSASGGAAHFATETGVLYTMETSPDLDPGNWTAVDSVAGDGTEKSLPLPPAAIRIFSRLRLTTP